MRRRMPIMILAALALVTGACTKSAGSSAEGTTSTPATETSTPSSPPSTAEPSTPAESLSPSETPSPSASPAMEDGRHFGYIKSIDLESQTMVFDLAYFLTGEEANQAAADHGDETPVPNDYYIVNDNPSLRTLAVAPDVKVGVIDWGNCCELVHGEIQPFVDAFAAKHHAWDAMYRGGESQYWLTVKGGVVILITEQYLP